MSTKKFGIFDIGIWITQKMVCYSTRKSSKWGICSLRGSFNPPNGSDNPWWPTVCIDKVLTDVHEKIWQFDVGIRITQKMVCYSTRKSSKWGLCSLRVSFYPPNGSDNPWWPTVCIDKVLANFMKKICIFDVEIRITQKMVCFSTRKSSNWGVCSLRGLFDPPNGRTICDNQPYA